MLDKLLVICVAVQAVSVTACVHVDGATINPASGINSDHLSYFKFAGRLLALAFIHRVTVGIELSKLLTCQMLKVAPRLEVSLDVESDRMDLKWERWQELAYVDPQWATSTRWISDHNVDEADLDLVFSVTTSEFGEDKQHDLVYQGASKAVTEVIVVGLVAGEQT